MKTITGVAKKEALEISQLLAMAPAGEVKVNGAVHTIRHMGDVAFVVLRKREGLLQCVYEEGVCPFSLKEIREGASVEFGGVLKKEERAPFGIELRIRSMRILSMPAEPLPLQIS